MIACLSTGLFYVHLFVVGTCVTSTGSIYTNFWYRKKS